MFSKLLQSKSKLIKKDQPEDPSEKKLSEKILKN